MSAIVVSSPNQLMPRWPDAAIRVYYETDDFVAGAALLGSSNRHASRSRARNVRRSDVVLGITDTLTHDLADGRALAATLSNGTDHRHFASPPDRSAAALVDLDGPVAGLVGQLNDRLDLDVLEAVADLPVSLLLVGPRHEVNIETTARLDALIARPHVQWVDRRPFDDLPAYLAAMDVGLTPYANTAFNRASFPLKTLEYLAAGLPVVSTDLPSAQALDTDLLTLATTPEEFAKMTADVLEQPVDPDLIDRRRAFAERHGWDARADQLLRIIDSARARTP